MKRARLLALLPLLLVVPVSATAAEADGSSRVDAAEMTLPRAQPRFNGDGPGLVSTPPPRVQGASASSQLGWLGMLALMDVVGLARVAVRLVLRF